jgi:hypothetical protein
MRAIAAFLGFSLAAGTVPAAAQALGTFAWQIEPYCNLVTFTVTPDGAAYRLTGYDDQCGVGKAPAAGVVTPNPDGTFTLIFYLITPDGQAGHTTATLAPGTYSGPWEDDAGQSGTARFAPAGSSGGPPRPVVAFQHRVTGICSSGEFVQKVREDGSVECGAATGGSGGDITAVTAGAGLTGGGVNGDVTIAIATGGVGSAQIADGSIGAADVNSSEVQRRVLGTCASGTYFSQILANGTPSCSAGASGTGVALGFFALSVNTGMGNTGIGHAALAANTNGTRNTAVGSQALNVSTVAGDNTAVGWTALQLTTSGNRNTAVGSEALQRNTIGFLNTGVGYHALQLTTDGSGNTAVGTTALEDNTTGSFNTAVGLGALELNTVGDGNSALGEVALGDNTTGSENTAVGAAALPRNTIGSTNTAVGLRSMFVATTGDNNVALGAESLRGLTSGSNNIGIGYLAATGITAGSNNILIGTPGPGDESDTIRIGNNHTRAFVRGIRGVTTGQANAVAVVVDSFGQLGTISSSRRTKEDIQDMGDASGGLFRLRPVTFRYLQPYADGSKPRDYGLIAEEVEGVYPDLVVRNAAGEVETVQYHKLVPMLLNEVQRQQRALEQQQREIDELRSAIAALHRQF